ncbi:MAG TPA: NAD-glutamate dehydrogenase domain-containing protein, partial [Chlamydiales bacterium]
MDPSLAEAIATESALFAHTHEWIKKHLPASFFEEVPSESQALIARQLMSFQLQNQFSQIHLKQMDIVLCLDGPDSDLKILKHYTHVAIRYYRTFISNAPPPGASQGVLKIAILYTRDAPKETNDHLEPKRKEELLRLIKAKNRSIHDGEFETLLHGLTPRFVRSLKNERLALAIELFFKAKQSDECQVEVIKTQDWKQKGSPSLQLVLAWKNVPKAGFLFSLASMIHHHSLAVRKVVATYIDPYSTESVLILSLGLHGLGGKAAWEEADLDDFLRELCLLKYFETKDEIETVFVKPKLLTGNEAHLVRNFASFAHQVLLLADPNLYSMKNVLEGLCRHPELTVSLCKVFEAKFKNPVSDYETLRKNLAGAISKLDTGQPINDLRRKNILSQALYFIEYTLKTNFYCPNKTGFSFRLNPTYLDHAPFERKEKFPELPFGIFFLRGMHWMGFNVRFKDLARGGVRTITPATWETFELERNNIFSEAYNLAYTQQKKNKDIPEGGSKTAILLAPFEVFAKEQEIFSQELEGMDPLVLEQRLKTYEREHKLAYLYASQRAFIESFMTLLNCDETGKLIASHVIDHYQRPEYIYLGPDENMLNDMIVWIANYSVQCGYKPGRSFMSSKPGAGINHKEYGVTSYGVNVYLHQALLFLGIDPRKDSFTVKISGGPDGDVAGNEVHILATQYAKTAKLLALTDVSGTIFDPEGLDWKEMDALFLNGKPIRHYPAEKLHEGGLLLDLQTKREETAYAQQTLCLKKKNGKLI